MLFVLTWILRYRGFFWVRHAINCPLVLFSGCCFRSVVIFTIDVFLIILNLHDVSNFNIIQRLNLFEFESKILLPFFSILNKIFREFSTFNCPTFALYEVFLQNLVFFHNSKTLYITIYSHFSFIFFIWCHFLYFYLLYENLDLNR